MKNKGRQLLTCALIGAISGIIFPSVLTFLTFQDSWDPRHLRDALLVFGTSGAIGGSLIGGILGLVSNTRIAAAGFGLVGGLCSCITVAIGVLLYTWTPWPAPRIYPGAEAATYEGGGSWGVVKTQVYTLTVPLEALQQHYFKEMKRFCTKMGDFEQVEENGMICHRAECQIRRPWMEEFFTVSLCTLSDRETVVYHTVMWED